MLTQESARALVESHLKQVASPEMTGVEFVILDDYTLVREFGWVFFYDSKEHFETGNFSSLLAGNAPIIVDRTDGSMHITGTAMPTEFYLENYVKFGTPYPPSGDSG